MTIAITGASGHIGNCLVQQLLKNGMKIKALNYGFSQQSNHQNLTLIKGSILDLESLKRLCVDSDVVFHLAAHIAIDNRNTELVYQTNVTGTKNILKAAMHARVKKFIHFSSIDAFQTNEKDKILNENTSLVKDKTFIYGYTKAQSEHLVHQAIEKGLNAHIISPTAVIGPYDYRGSFLGKALIQIYKDRLPFIVKGGYNWVDVRDVVSASVLSIKKGNCGDKYILPGNFHSLKDLSRIICQLSGGRIPWEVPISLARIANPFFYINSLLFNKTPLYTNQSLTILKKSPTNISYHKAKQTLNYQPRPTYDTLVDTFNWYKEHHYIK